MRKPAAPFEKAKFLDSLRRQCSRREYCETDIRRKICDAHSKAPAADCSVDEALESIIASLKADRYLSDARYASAFARDKASLSGWGAVKIRYMLSSKGISKADIAAALESVEEKSADDRMEKLMEAKYRLLKGDPQCRIKLLRFALGRGYQYDEVEDVVRRLCCGEADDD